MSEGVRFKRTGTGYQVRMGRYWIGDVGNVRHYPVTPWQAIDDRGNDKYFPTRRAAAEWLVEQWEKREKETP